MGDTLRKMGAALECTQKGEIAVHEEMWDLMSSYIKTSKSTYHELKGRKLPQGHYLMEDIKGSKGTETQDLVDELTFLNARTE